ncbi:MAG: hypothetical protein NZ521_11545, partial [Flammeovirgaceae bacterium]|nr:hypothetical protein [Flammeovirgaceae bacterium]MDW8288827.1 hypothetical protein [Flammeovirgaceae bacterium]
LGLNISKVFYKVLIGWGIFWIITFPIALTDKKIQEDISGYLVILLFIGIIPMSIGVFFLKKASKKEKKIREEEIEVTLVQLAHSKKGEISAHDVVMHMKITTEKAKQMLEDLYLKGIFDIEVTDDGNVKYRLK